MKKNQKTTPLRPERGCGRTKAGRAALPKVQPSPEPAESAGNERRDPFLLDGEELLMRAASFAQSGAVPPELVHGLAAEVEAFVGA